MRGVNSPFAAVSLSLSDDLRLIQPVRSDLRTVDRIGELLPAEIESQTQCNHFAIAQGRATRRWMRVRVKIEFGAA